eukprot:UN28397
MFRAESKCCHLNLHIVPTTQRLFSRKYASIFEIKKFQYHKRHKFKNGRECLIKDVYKG